MRNIIPYHPALKERARQLRNHSRPSEIRLWKSLKGKFMGRYDFHRQKPLDHYIVDFFCHELRLVIEIDGFSHDDPETRKKEKRKELRLIELGLYVLRFSDQDVFQQLESTLGIIRQYVVAFESGDFSSFRYEGSPLNPLMDNQTENEIP